MNLGAESSSSSPVTCDTENELKRQQSRDRPEDAFDSAADNSFC